MKQKLLFFFLPLITILAKAQPTTTTYPEPEFRNEIYFLKKDSIHSLTRLEKGTSKMDTKVKMAGFGGAESAYNIDGEQSAVRLNPGNSLSFIISNGASSSLSSPQSDSVIKAQGLDPSAISGMMEGMYDPANIIALYKVEPASGKRKIMMQKSPGSMPFGSKKIRSSEKFTFSVKKIRDGYWEMVIDKKLSKGEYAFTMMDLMNMNNMTGSVLIFSFGIE